MDRSVGILAGRGVRRNWLHASEQDFDYLAYVIYIFSPSVSHDLLPLCFFVFFRGIEPCERRFYQQISLPKKIF